MTTTFRADVADGLLGVLNTFATAHPTLLVRAYRARPASFPDLPAAYIADRSETITHTQGVRTRTLGGLSFVVVDRITDNAETMQRFDTLVDTLLDAITASPQLGTTGIWSGLSITDEDAPFGDYDFKGVRFAFPDISIMEGRT